MLVVEAASLLGFVSSERGDIELTPSGKMFAEAGIATRKGLFRKSALAHITLLQQMSSALASKSNHAMPLELFRDILATDENRTILVSTGTLRGMSDLDGRHVIRLNNSAERRNDLVQRLKVAGCHPNTNGTDWLSVGNFERYA